MVLTSFVGCDLALVSLEARCRHQVRRLGVDTAVLVRTPRLRNGKGTWEKVASRGTRADAELSRNRWFGSRFGKEVGLLTRSPCTTRKENESR